MPELNIDRFNPTVAELTALAEGTKSIDQGNLKEVKSARLTLRDARVAITKKGKEMRSDALDFQKAVIAKEKELIAIIEPEEKRLQSIEDEAAKKAEMARRLEVLPRRKELIAKVFDDRPSGPTDEDLLAMNDDQYVEFRNGAIAARNKRDAEKLDADRRKFEAEKEEEKRNQDLAEAEERGRKEAAEKAEREAEELKRKEREERERLEKEARYREWRSSLGWTPDARDEFKEEKVGYGTEIVLWKKLGTFKIVE